MKNLKDSGEPTGGCEIALRSSKFLRISNQNDLEQWGQRGQGAMSIATATRRSPQLNEHVRSQGSSNGDRRAYAAGNENVSHGGNGQRREQKARVFVAAENRLLREALSRMLSKSQDIEVLVEVTAELDRAGISAQEEADILLISSQGNLDQDLTAIRKVRAATPGVHILLIDASEDETTFLQCIRAGVRGYLPRDASAEDVVDAVRAMHAGKAVCPGTLCAVLFRNLEQEATSFPSACVHRRLGLTRREQQLIPLIAEGLTNKEIANRFCLSEQTVKNHLYRMKQKIAAEDRLDIVQVCRAQGFMI